MSMNYCVFALLKSTDCQVIYPLSETNMKYIIWVVKPTKCTPDRMQTYRYFPIYMGRKPPQEAKET